MLRDLGVMPLPKWDITNAMIFDTVRKEKDTHFKTEEEVLQAHKGLKYSDDHQSLVIWLIQKRDKARTQSVSNSEHIGSLLVYIENEVDSDRVARIRKEIEDFGVVVAAKDKNKFLELNNKFERLLETYEERGRRINQMEGMISQMEKQLGKRNVGEESSETRITYPPHPLVAPFTQLQL